MATRDEEAFAATALPTLLPSMRTALRMTKVRADESAQLANQEQGSPHLFDAHSLLHLSCAYPWRNQAHRRDRAASLLGFIQSAHNKKRYPLQCFIAAIVMLQRIWRGVLCRRRLLRSLRARQALQKAFSEIVVAAAAASTNVGLINNNNNDTIDTSGHMRVVGPGTGIQNAADGGLSNGGVEDAEKDALFTHSHEDDSKVDDICDVVDRGMASTPPPPPPPPLLLSSVPSQAMVSKTSVNAEPQTPRHNQKKGISQEEMRKVLRRALPWPAFSDRAARYERCVKIYNVMEHEERGYRSRKSSEQKQTIDDQLNEGESDGNRQHDEDEETLLRTIEIESAVKGLQQRARALMMHREVEAWWMRERWPIFFVAAVRIQRAWIGYTLRKNKLFSLTSSPLLSSDASPQSPYLLNLEAQKWRRKMHRRFFLTKADAAAARVQSWWRRCLQRKIFRYYVRIVRDCASIVGANKVATVNYGRSRPLEVCQQNQGTSATSSPPIMAAQRAAFALLKQIDFGEACMIQQPGSGLHVRFRLTYGGVVPFPPVIVYKVSTHKSVVDIGLFAPKDYVLEAKIATEKRNNPIIVHNKLSTIGQQKRKFLTANLGMGTGFSNTAQATSTSSSNSSSLNALQHKGGGGANNSTHQTFGVSGSATRCFDGLTSTKLKSALIQGARQVPPSASASSLPSGGGEDSSSVDSPLVKSVYERRDNNPWRLADTKALADDSVLSGLLRDYERAAARSKISKMKMASTSGIENKKGAAAAALHCQLALINPALLAGSQSSSGKTNPVAFPKVLVSACRSQAATAGAKKKAVDAAIIATQRRWLAELYASEKAFEALSLLKKLENRQIQRSQDHDGRASSKKATSTNTAEEPSVVVDPALTTSYVVNRARAEILFRNVPLEELQKELAKVRAWHGGLDYNAYRTSWLGLGASM